MLNRLIEFTLQNRVLVLLLFCLAMILGVWRLLHLPVDAFPDTTPVQVQMNTVAPALNPEEIEQQITFPVELAIGGLPGLVGVRSVSKFGFSQVVATFEDRTSVLEARQFVTERLSSVQLPAGIERPQLGPISTGLGEVFHYLVRSDNPARSLEELRTIHDWIIKPQLRKVPGVAEVNSWGGKERQYHVVVHPDALIKYRLTMDDVVDALEANNLNVGGGQIETSGVAQTVHGLGRVGTLEDIGNIVLAAFDGTPVFVRDVAEVEIGHEIRRGAVTAHGQGEVVLGLAFMLMGENSKVVTDALKDELENVRRSLPDDVIVEVVYDRTALIDQVIDTVRHNLTGGAALVILFLFLILGNLRAGILVALTIPMAMLFAVLGMYEFSIAASLLSLGAVDFGILVDGSVVMTEANMRNLSALSGRYARPLTAGERLSAVAASSRQVARPVVFGIGIIIVVFLPILALEGIEGKLFRPMALTFMLALIGALLIALFLSPVLSYYALPRKVRHREPWTARALSAVFGFALSQVLRFRALVLLLLIVLLVCTGWFAWRLGGEFVPRMSEGAIAINTIRLAGTAIGESVQYNTRIETLLKEAFPNEIAHIWSRIGTAEVATDPMGIELTDIFLTLTPRSQWTKATSQAELTERIQQTVQDLPGLNMVMTQPIEMRINEMVAGVRADVAVKIYGDDFAELVRLSDDIQRILTEIPGTSDLSADQITGQPTVRVRVRPERLARYGVNAQDVLRFVEAVGGLGVGEVFEGQRSFPLIIRLPDQFRRDAELLAETLIPTRSAAVLPLSALAEVDPGEGPSTINREWGRRLMRVQCNVVGRDLASFVAEARRRLNEQLTLPEGYVVDWGGQFEYLQRARQRLAVLVPLALALVFFLLFFSLKSLRDVLLIYTAIPFAVIGGVFALAYRGMPFSVSAAVGFIALTGIAVLNGQILIAAIRSHLTERKTGLRRNPHPDQSTGHKPGDVDSRSLHEAGNHSLREAVIAAAKQRLRPVLATAITDAAGFVPMAVSTGVGAEVQRPLATVVIGGVLTSTLLTLFVLPLLYDLLGRSKSENSI